MEGNMETGQDGHRKIMILLLIFMILGIIIFGAWSYNLVKEKTPTCSWEMPENPVSRSYEEVHSNTSAKELLIKKEDVPSNSSVKVKQLNTKYWQIDVVKEGEVMQRYGVNSMGHIYKYKERCAKGNQTILNQLKDLFSNVKKFKNQSSS